MPTIFSAYYACKLILAIKAATYYEMKYSEMGTYI